MRLFGRFGKRTWRDHVSAYVDGELDAADRAWFEAQLDGTPEVRAAVEAERELRSLLVAALPAVSAPRSFALTPEIAAANRPMPSAPVAAQARGFSKFAGATSAVAAFAFFVVLAADTAGSPDGDDSSSPASASAEFAPMSGESSSATSAGGSAGASAASDSESLQYGERAGGESNSALGSTRDAAAEDATGQSDTDALRQGADDTAASSGAAPPAGDGAQLALRTDDGRTTGGLGAVKVGLAIVAVTAAAAFVFTRRIGTRDA